MIDKTVDKVNDILSEIMMRKIDARKLALDNYDSSEYDKNNFVQNENENFSDEINEIINQMMYNLQKTNELYDVSQMRHIVSNKKVIGRFVVFIKRVLRRILNSTFGWYFNASAIRQREFNDSCVKTLNLIKDLIVKQIEKDTNLNKYNVDLKNDLKNENTILKNNIADLKNENSSLINEISSLKKKILLLNEQSDNLKKESSILRDENDYILNRLNVSCDLKLLKNAPSIDYFKFENEFRGKRDDIMRNQECYVEYFKTNGGGRILDIGAGRGEFLELMFNYGISAKGVDCYKPFVEYCRDRGFDVDLNDALTYVNSLPDCSLGGIFMSQVVEHLSEDYVRALIAASYKKLKPGCYFILETPNPDCVAAITQFNLDISHIKPVHFLSLKYLFEENNFSYVERFHPKESLYPLHAVKIESEHINNIDEFNKGIEYIDNMLFGYRDYALIARK